MYWKLCLLIQIEEKVINNTSTDYVILSLLKCQCLLFHHNLTKRLFVLLVSALL